MKTIKERIIWKALRPNKYNYIIWRGILEFLYMRKKNKELTKECIDMMGTWASGKVTLEGKEKSEGYWGAVEQIIDAFCIDNTLYAYTRRPGLLIGKGGETIDDLRDYLGVDSIRIIETPVWETTYALRTSYKVATKFI